MSWDKNTISMSSLKAILKTLENVGIPHEVSVIGTFKGRGLNDDPYMNGTDTTYELRRLQYQDRVILEHVELDGDCDTDDVIVSTEFWLKDEPKNWEPIRRTNKTGECPGWIKEI